MKIILCDINEELGQAWKTEFRSGRRLPDNVAFDFYHGSILDLDGDAIVSPANSFGFMDGSLDLIYTEFFGRHLQQRLKDHLHHNFFDELLVGQAAVIPTNHPKIPWLISAPTMRVPKDLNGSVNVYLASRAILRAVKQHNFETTLVPGLGTGVGCLDYAVAAGQMRRGFVDAFGLPQVGSLWERSYDEKTLIEGKDTQPFHRSMDV